MFISLILVCTLDGSYCEIKNSGMGYTLEQNCLNSIADGIEYYESQGNVVEAYDCYRWDDDFFSESS
jgi:hypothetical protein